MFVANQPIGFGLMIIPLAGILVGLFTVVRLRKRSDEFTGLGAAKVGLVLSTLVFFSRVSHGAPTATRPKFPRGISALGFTNYSQTRNIPNGRFRLRWWN